MRPISGLVRPHSPKQDWSLIMGRGGGAGHYKTAGGAVKFYPYKEGMADKVLAMLKGGGAQQVLG